MRLPVLDHGYVQFVDAMGDDRTIIEAARMSTGKGFLGWEPRPCDCTVIPPDGPPINEPTPDCPLCNGLGRLKGDQRLLDFLYRHQHMTPFEMGELHLEIQAPIMVFREWHRHRTQSYNEFSARYAVMPNLHYVPDEHRFRSVGHNKQGADGEALPPEKIAEYRAAFAAEQAAVYERYQRMLAAGLAPEVARLDCPVSRYSRMRVKTDLRNWLAFLLLRMSRGAQWEIRQYANAVATIVQSRWPRTYALFEEYTLHAITLSRSEVDAMHRFVQAQERTPTLVGALKKLGLSVPETDA